MATNDDDLGVFIHDMIAMSDFVYRFANIRSIVRTKHGTKESTGYFGFGEEKEIKFDRPALILTQLGAQRKKGDKFLKYEITLPAISEFLEINRNWFLDAATDGSLTFDLKESSEEPLEKIEKHIKDQSEDNIKIIDYDDKYVDGSGGLVYAIVLNLTKKWVCVVFRGTIGATDARADLNYTLNDTWFEGEGDVLVHGGKPATHNGFMQYLTTSRKGESRPYLQRILTCLSEQFEENTELAGKDFKLFVTGHSLGAALANLFAFRVAQLKKKGDESTKYLPDRVKALTFAAPCSGNVDFNKEYQVLEKEGFLRHIRISNAFDVVPTNNIIAPFSLLFTGDTSLYTQNGVNLYLHVERKLDTYYRNTLEMGTQFSVTKSLSSHSIAEYHRRVALPENKEVYQKTVEEFYKIAGDYTN
mmetsp:Transcript_22088/g.52563  ORF Transcript_22088/g.52563 Transcript_22088/m.52563 type:complete len:416 (+) Transcript_22088:127-1374(+)